MKTIVFTTALLLSVTLPAVAAESPGPLDLDRALALALEHNYAIRQARARFDEAGGALVASRAGHLPNVSLASSYSRVDRSLLETPPGTPSLASPTAWDAGVQAQQTVYSGGAVESGIAAARAARAAAQADFETAVQGALLGVRERYFAVLLARAQVGVQEEAVRLLEEEFSTARSRVTAGTGSPFDQLRAEVALANGQPPLIRARNTYRLAAVELLRAIGLPAPEGAEGTITGELAFAPREFELEALLASARANRPELRQLERLVDAAGADVGLARSGLRPNLALVAGYGIQKSAYTDDLDDTVDGWSVGVQGSWPIFDGRATRGRVTQARARLEQTRLGLDETLLAIDSEVRRAFSSYREAGDLVAASQRVVEQAQESLRLARSRFDVGAATQLDVLQTQVALTEARTNGVLALHDANVALARLERAAGLAQMPASVRLE